MGKLTAAAAKARLANPGTYQHGDGLFLKVGKTGAASWILRVQQDGKRKDVGLGSARQMSPAQARNQANQARRAIKVEHRDVLLGR